MVGSDMQTDHGAEAAAEHRHRLVGEVGEQTVYVVRVIGHRRWAVEPAPGETAAVVREHCVLVLEVSDQVDRAVGVAFTALRDQQQRAAAFELVVEDGAGNFEDRHGSRLHLSRYIYQDASELM